MRGRTMFVVPYIMGPPDSPLAKVGFEITDSKYVVLSMRIMTRMGAVAVKRLGDDVKAEWNRGTHSIIGSRSGAPVHLPFPARQHHHSVGSGYGGNVLLSKKCLALRIVPISRASKAGSPSTLLILGSNRPKEKNIM